MNAHPLNRTAAWALVLLGLLSGCGLDAARPPERRTQGTP